MSAGDGAGCSWQRSTTVEGQLSAGELEPAPVTVDDLLLAVDWLGAYDGDDDGQRQQLANVIGLLERRVAELRRRQLVAEAKRAYAAEHGVPVSQVRLRRP